jgi:hypothetical protein
LTEATVERTSTATRFGSSGAPVRLAFSALLLTALVGAAVVPTQRQFLQSQPFYSDAVGHSLHGARLALEVEQRGRWATAIRELRDNPRFPLRTVPLVLLAPGQLAAPAGHAWVPLAALWCFLAVLGATVFRRSGSEAYAFGAMALFCSMARHYEPKAGLGSNWLDLTAALFLGAAAFLLLDCRLERGHAARLLAFGLLASAAALSRYISAGYALVICGPVLAGSIAASYLRSRSLPRSVLVPLALTGGPVLVAAVIPYLLPHLSAVLAYYRTFGYPLESRLSISETTMSWVSNYTIAVGGKWIVLLLLGLLALNLAHGRRGKEAAADLLPVVWFAVSFYLLYSVVLRQDGHHGQAAVFGLPGLFLLAVSPVSWTARAPGFGRAVGAGLVLAAAGLGVRHANAAAAAVMAMSPERHLQDRLAEEIARHERPTVWDAYAGDYSAAYASLEGFYRTGRLPVTAHLYSEHETYLRGYFPGRDPESVARVVLGLAHDYTDFALVAADARKVGGLARNPFTAAVSTTMARCLPGDPDWEMVGRFDGTRWGDLRLYRNRRSRSSEVYAGLLSAPSYEPSAFWADAGPARLRDAERAPAHCPVTEPPPVAPLAPALAR